MPPELEKALRDSRSSDDIEVRKDAFSRLQRLIMENALMVPLAFQFDLVAMNKRVQGYKSNLLGKARFDDVWLQS